VGLPKRFGSWLAPLAAARGRAHARQYAGPGRPTASAVRPGGRDGYGALGITLPTRVGV
jgi:hypothetical protein